MVDGSGTTSLAHHQDTSKTVLVITHLIRDWLVDRGGASGRFLATHPEMSQTNIMCILKDLSASLADSWASQHGLTNVLVWGDTTDYMSHFAGAVGGISLYNVVDLRTMELVTMT